jgi:protein-S-isoprenylcysteine O-methyltransferase Ste14
MSGWRQARAIALLPGIVTIVVPLLILLLGRGPRIGWGLGGLAGVLVALCGLALICAGFVLWLWTVSLFQRIGRGTLAPWDPTTRLVVAGPYRHVRNPMISGVAGILAGEAILFGSPAIAVWAAFFVVVNHVNFLLVEERGLERRFGEPYRAYRAAVPRWVPRRRPAGDEPKCR